MLLLKIALKSVEVYTEASSTRGAEAGAADGVDDPPPISFMTATVPATHAAATPSVKVVCSSMTNIE